MTTTSNTLVRHTPATTPALRTSRALVRITSPLRQGDDGSWLRAGILVQVRLGRLAVQATIAVARQANR